MTMNMTVTSPTDNREFLVVDTDPADVADAEAIFRADFTNVDVRVKGKLVVSPQQASTPDARARIVSLVDNARFTLSVEGETFSDTEVTSALVAAKKRGLAVKVVLDGTIEATPAQQTAVAALKAAAIGVVTVKTPTIHSKAIVSDGTRAYVGSQNFTMNSLMNNRELGVIFDNAAAVKTVESTILADHAAGKAL
jgi:phosphatidylserine/phosphatidylglycerophosphate/cardiolipin synthase-like enzyme